MNPISLIFQDENNVKKIQTKLPELFQIAELESSRAGKIGMEVGTIRERIIVALLLHVFGEKNIETEIPTTETETDVLLYGHPISIKTFTGKNFTSVKLIWTVDRQKAVEFQKSYYPVCDMILVQINWGGYGALYWFSKESQIETLERIGRDRYIKLPVPGTNPRGVEITPAALGLLAENRNTMYVPITWIKRQIQFNTFERWVDLWANE